jgi:hypothetical protein
LINWFFIIKFIEIKIYYDINKKFFKTVSLASFINFEVKFDEFNSIKLNNFSCKNYNIKNAQSSKWHQLYHNLLISLNRDDVLKNFLTKMFLIF